METESRSPGKSLLLSFGVALVLLTPLGVYIFLRSQDGGPGLRKDEPTVEAAAKTAEKKQVIPPLEGDKPQARPQRKPAPVVVVAAQPTPQPQRPFPTPRDIPLGMEKYRLIASFGKPSIVTTEVTEGRASEIFRYLKPEAGLETVVFLRSGRVISATASVY